MQHVDFTSEELEVLRELLQHITTEMDVEVFRTDTHDFKTMLKHRRDLVERILAKLSSAAVTA
jgi:hypothetical protein